MKIELKRTAAVSLLVLTLGAGLAGCATPSSDATAGTDSKVSAAPTGETAEDKAAAGAKSTMDKALADVKAELPLFRSKITKDMSEEDIPALIEASFPKTLSHVKKDAFSPQVRAELVNSLGQPYMVDESADVESKLSAYKVSGNTAVTSARDFDLWFGGKAEGIHPSPSGEPSTFTLTKEGDQWVISGYDSGR